MNSGVVAFESDKIDCDDAESVGAYIRSRNKLSSNSFIVKLKRSDYARTLAQVTTLVRPSVNI
jgi:hypothetical protein